MVDNFSVIISNAKENGKLIFKNSGIKSIPKNNLQLPFNDIYYIDLSGNKFSGIPDVVTEFICLQVLLCNHNMIRCLPSNINNISYLETLDLSCNHLTSLHPSVCKLLCLKILVISSNRLMSLPTTIGRLSSLEELDASCNSLTCLPEELSCLNRLRYLNLRHNKLLDLPTNLHKLELEVFDLSENQLTTIPSEFHRIDTLQTLNLSGNPLNFPPANVCNKGLQHIMKYLQSDSKRQSNRKLSNMSTQNSVDYSTTNGYKSEPLPFEINGVDSMTMTSTNSRSSRSEYDFELDSNLDYEDGRVHSYESTSVNIVSSPKYTRKDTSNEDLHSYHQPRRNSISNLPSPVAANDSLYSDNVPGPVLSTIEEANYQDHSLTLDDNAIKNLNITSIKITANVKNNSPSSYRSSRFVMKNPPIDTNKARHSSVPSKERVPTQTVNTSNKEIDLSSQCVVVVDNNSNNESRKSSSHSVHNQFNNNNSTTIATTNNRFIKNVHASPHRVLRPKFSEPEFDRKSSLKTESLSSRSSESMSAEKNLKTNERIAKFHKIIEAQLHVHINGKKLSEELSNGIYLCHLANILIPHSIPTVHTPSPGQQELGKQKSKRNLDNFLETCRRNGVTENCLFTARDVINCNPIGLVRMAQTVDALIESIRTKRAARPLLETRSSSTISNRSGDSHHIDWHGVLSNPHSLSQRSFTHNSSRSSVSGYRTVGRPSKATHRIVTTTKKPCEDIVQYSSEV